VCSSHSRYSKTFGNPVKMIITMSKIQMANNNNSMFKIIKLLQYLVTSECLGSNVEIIIIASIYMELIVFNVW